MSKGGKMGWLEKSNVLGRAQIFCLCVLVVFGADIYGQITWEKMNGPYGGRVYSIATHDEHKIISRGTTFRRSLDGGDSWEFLPTGVSIGDVKYDSHGNLWAVRGQVGELYMSTDDGETWQARFDGLPSETIWDFAFGADSTVVVSQNPRTVFRSPDLGQTWEDISDNGQAFSISVVLDLAIHPFTKGVFAASTRKLFAFDSDLGAWAAVDTLGNEAFDLVFAARNGDIFAGGFHSYRSTDNGATWQKLTEGLPEVGGFDLMTELEDGTLISVISARLYRSQDNGDTWVAEPREVPQLVTTQSLASNDANDVFTGSFYGINRSKDSGNTWESIGQNDLWITDIFATSANTILVASNDGVYRSESDGAGFDNLAYNNVGPVQYSMAERSDGGILLGTAYGVRHSMDDGITWLDTDLSKGARDFLALGNSGWIAGVSFYQTTMIGEEGGIYKSVDDGLTWTAKALVGTLMDELTSDFQGNLVAAGHDPFTTTGLVFQSQDEGESWTEIAVLDHRIVGLEYDPNTGKFVCATTNGVYIADASAINWVESGLTNERLEDVVVTSNGKIYVASGNGVFQSFDMGNSWSNAGFAGQRVTALMLDEDEHLYSAVYLDGLFRTAVSVALNTGEGSGFQWRLEQNYPNPFNGETKIEFSVETQGHVSLSIYNLLGEKIVTLTNTSMSPGNYSIRWDGRLDNREKAASGVYFYRLQTDRFLETRKMLLIE